VLSHSIARNTNSVVFKEDSDGRTITHLSFAAGARKLGYDNITLYDGSMDEWAKDESLPIETD
jgi:3-mercaptopyruvate sulfurtransferase SseA